jgi:hypothetical protein
MTRGREHKKKKQQGRSTSFSMQELHAMETVTGAEKTILCVPTKTDK